MLCTCILRFFGPLAKDTATNDKYIARTVRHEYHGVYGLIKLSGPYIYFFHFTVENIFFSAITSGKSEELQLRHKVAAVEVIQGQLNLLKVVGAQLTNKTHFYCEKLNSYEHL